MRFLVFILLASLSASAQTPMREYYALMGSDTTAAVIIDPLAISGNQVTYSLRAARTGYTGNIFDARRSSDNTVQTFGLVGGYFDTAAYKTFIGTGTGYCAKWYDESGNAKHAVQTTAANQPEIKRSDSSWHWELKFDGTDFLTITSSTNYLKNLHSTFGTVAVVAKAGTSSNPNAYLTYLGNVTTGSQIGFSFQFDDRASVPRNNALVTQVTKGVASNNPITSVDPDATYPNRLMLHMVTLDVANAAYQDRMRLYVNNTLFVHHNVGLFTPSTADATQDMQIGAAGNGTLLLIGNMRELFIYNKIISTAERTALSTNINTHFTLY